MASKMLIDAAHPEETRVVVVRNKRIDDFDYEASARKQLRGNIYLAKVTRVEPSLQAAFVDYGGNRHGFLAFSEIHPDYYQIPVADRQALLREEAEEQSQAEAEDAAKDQSAAGETDSGDTDAEDGNGGGEPDDDLSDPSEDYGEEERALALEDSALDQAVREDIADDPEEVPERRGDGGAKRRGRRRRGRADDFENGRDRVESVGSEDALEEVPERVLRHRRRIYKIQEVIKRRQVILVQVVKEERGNKGAALTTYLSLAGRYTVLMPNTARGGGISRKITNPADRKRLRKIAGDLDVPDGMGLIIRTAGAARTRAEIKRDYDYLLRLWENVRDLTLKSSAPTLVYEEGNLIKRSIRDLYDKEIDEILVAGEEAYKEAKDFMRMLMPSHAKNVKAYKDPEPVFVRHGIERQLSAMFSPYVTLKSGGYIVLNQTEALVAIDVNSGKATREHNIEDTALKTNLEAAEEIARQLRLRDLAGLIVIDFIDMDERRNNRAVERKLKECLRTERARVQVGRISPFGLLEMSRQRLRAGVLAGTTMPCAVCQGTGVVRSTESVALDVLRSVEDALMAAGPHPVTALAPVEVCLYILNQKRAYLQDIETRYGVGVAIEADEKLQGGSFRIEKAAGAPEAAATAKVVQMDWAHVEDDKEIESEEEGEAGRRRKRRRRKRQRSEQGEAEGPEPVSMADEADTDAEAEVAEAAETDAGEARAGEEEPARKTRRRGRRGGRRARKEAQPAGDNGGDSGEPGERDTVPGAAGHGSDADAGTSAEAEPTEAAEPAETGRRERRVAPDRGDGEPEDDQGASAATGESGNGRHQMAMTEPARITDPEALPASADADEGARASAEPHWGERAAPEAAARDADDRGPRQHAEDSSGDSGETGTRRRGWWQRRLESRG